MVYSECATSGALWTGNAGQDGLTDWRPDTYLMRSSSMVYASENVQSMFSGSDELCANGIDCCDS
jgi:hypothetical protein